MPIWISFTLLAAIMQSVRTAAQKDLSQSTSAWAATSARYIHGLPFVVLYFAGLLYWFGAPEGWNPARFLIGSLIAATFQILATLILVRLFAMRHFAVATMYIKAEVLLTAIIGTLFFTEVVTGIGWLAMIIAFMGLIFLTIAKQGWVSPLKLITEPSAALGLLSALMFALTSLFLRDASQQIDHDSVLVRASAVLLAMVSMQAVICGLWLFTKQADRAKILFSQWRLPVFIGFTSMAGSTGWFTAMASVNASYVKTFGQIELFFVMLIGLIYFKERPHPLEWLGFGVLLLGIVLLLLSAL